MRTMIKLFPVGLAAVLLAACASAAGPDGARAANGPTSAPASPSPRVLATTSRPTCGIDSPCESDDPRTTPPPVAPTVDLPDACDLVIPRDLNDVTSPEVDLEFTGDPTDEPPHVEPATGRGVTSFCRRFLRSHYVEHRGTTTAVATADGQVDVRVQSDGANLYFPVRAGDTAVGGLGDEAMLRYTTLYVRIGGRLLIIQVGITSDALDVGQIQARDIEWAKELAAIAIDRL